MNSHFVGKTNTNESEKDLWQTPQCLFDTLDQEFNFEMDACADDYNHLCHVYFTESDSALESSWVCNCFLNPPYSQTELFLLRANEQAKRNNITVVALVNANTDTKWFKAASETANEIRLISGRVGFVKPDGTKANGNPKGQCLIIWRGNCKTPCQITVVKRNDLY